MRNIDHLIRQVEAIVREVQERQRRKDESAIVIYDYATGVPLPGYEPKPGAVYTFWLPDNGRDARQR